MADREIVPITHVSPAVAAPSSASPVPTGSPAPRRGYGPVDMKLDSCVSRQRDQTLAGKGCSSRIVVFGPYVAAPAESDVDISFDVDTKTKIAVVSDIVSSAATLTHASLLEQWVEAGTRRRFGYRVHLFKAVTGLETRIFVRADTPADFRIQNLIVNVR